MVLMDSDVSSISSESPEAAALMQRSLHKQFKSRIFLGRYVDRRLVSEGVGYRDLVLVSPAEEELTRELLDLRRRLAVPLAAQVRWCGVTDTRLLPEYKPGVCLWTEIDDQPFGAFWFEIRALEFRPYEVLLRVRCVRQITPRFIELEPMLTADSVACSPSPAVCLTAHGFLQDLKDMVLRLRMALTVSDVKDFIFFVFALIVAAATSSVALVSYLGTFTLSLLRELSNLIRNSTPMFLGFLDFISKIVGGFYLLLAMIFRQTSPTPLHSRQLAPYNARQQYKRSGSAYDDNFDYHRSDID